MSLNRIPPGTSAVVLDEEHLGSILAAAVRRARSWGFSRERLEDIRTALEEACRNALEHSAPGAIPVPSLDMMLEGPRFTVIVMSPGAPFALPEAKPDLHRKMDGAERPRGWGLFLIRSLADDVSLTSHDGVNLLRIVFTLREAPEGPERG